MIALKTTTLKAEEVFSAGKYNGDEYSEADLDAMVSAYQELKGRLDPPLKLGHNDKQPDAKEFERDDGKPAMGWVENLRRVGKKLLADFVQVPQQVVDWVKEGRYKKKSAEIYWGFKDGDKTYRRVLKAVALLGADIPANRDIAPLQYDEAGHEYHVAEYAELPTATINDLPDAAFAAIMPGGKKDEGGKTTPRSLRMLPHHTAGVTSPTDNESVDLPHLRNALARIKQADMPAPMMRRAMSHLEAHAKALQVGEREMEEINQAIKEVTKHMEDVDALTKKYAEVEAANKALADQVKAFSEQLAAIQGKATEAEAARTKAEADAKSYADKLAAVETNLATERKARRLSELKSVVADFPHIPGSVEEKADKLYRLESVDAKLFEERMAEWRTVNAQLEEGGLFRQYGAGGERPSAGSAQAQLGSLLQKAVEAGTYKSQSEAAEAVYSAHPRLYAEAQREHDRRATRGGE